MNVTQTKIVSASKNVREEIVLAQVTTLKTILIQIKLFLIIFQAIHVSVSADQPRIV